MKTRLKLTPEQWEAAEFIGVYHEPNRPNQRIPIRRYEGKHFDLLGYEVDLAKLVLREDA